MPVLNEMETLLYDASRVFLWPVWLLTMAALVYALIMLGAFVVESLQRRWSTRPRALFYYAQQGGASLLASDGLELWIMHRLECVAYRSHAGINRDHDPHGASSAGVG